MRSVLTGILLVSVIVFSVSSRLHADSIISDDESVPCHIRKILGPFLRHSDQMVPLYRFVERAEVTLSEDDLKRAEKEVKAVFGPGDFMGQYLRARIEFAYGSFHLDIRGNKKLGKDAFERAQQTIELALARHGEFSDAHRLAGDIYGRLIDVKGALIFGPLYGPKSNRLLKKAEALDSRNPEAYLGRGRGYLYTPVAFGGGKKKALQSFQEAIRLCPDYYAGHLWSGEFYRLRGLNELAKKSLQKVLELEPDSGWAKEMLATLR